MSGTTLMIGDFEDGLTGWSTTKHAAGDGWGYATTTSTTYSETANSCKLTASTDPDKSIIIYKTADLTNATGITFDFAMGEWATGESNWLGAAIQVWNDGEGDYDNVWETNPDNSPVFTFTSANANLTAGYTGNCTVRVWLRWYTPV